jgi:hemerythrin-like domain-containing protein
MNATELLAALNTVEQDHRLVLEKSQALKDIVSYLVEGGGMDGHQLLNRLRDINKYFATEFENHLEEEETTLFPLFEKHKPEGSELAARLRLEHTDLRRKRQEFEDCLEVAGSLEDTLPRAVLRDLLGYGWEFWQVLDSHAHTEARGLHQYIAQSLAEGEATGEPQTK